MSQNSADSDTTIYVGNIDPRVTREHLYELFIQVAPVVKIRYPRDKMLQTYQGYAFIELETIEDVKYTIQAMHNTVSLYDRVLKIRKSVPSSSNNNNVNINNNANNKNNVNTGINTNIDPPIAKLFVKGLDETVDANLIKKVFQKFGPFYKEPEIFYIKSNTVKCAFVYFKYYRDADEAIKKLNDEFIVNQRISIEYSIKENRKNGKYGNDTDRLLNTEAERNKVL